MSFVGRIFEFRHIIFSHGFPFGWERCGIRFKPDEVVVWLPSFNRLRSLRKVVEIFSPGNEVCMIFSVVQFGGAQTPEELAIKIFAKICT